MNFLMNFLRTLINKLRPIPKFRWVYLIPVPHLPQENLQQTHERALAIPGVVGARILRTCDCGLKEVYMLMPCNLDHETAMVACENPRLLPGGIMLEIWDEVMKSYEFQLHGAQIMAHKLGHLQPGMVQKPSTKRDVETQDDSDEDENSDQPPKDSTENREDRIAKTKEAKKSDRKPN